MFSTKKLIIIYFWKHKISVFVVVLKKSPQNYNKKMTY